MLTFVRIFIVLLFVGSNVYVIDTSLSLLNVYFVALLFVFPLMARGITYSKEALFFFGLNLLLFLIAAVYLVFSYREPNQIKDFYYLFYIVFIPFMFYSVYKKEGQKLFQVIYNYSYIMLILSLIVIVYELKTGNHLPVHNTEKEFREVPSGFFTNPNDMAAVSVMFFPFLLYWGLLKRRYFQTIIIALVVFSISIICFSRITFLLFLSLPIFWVIVKQKYVLFISLLAAIVLGILTLLQFKLDYTANPDSIWERNINRAAAFLDEDDKRGYSSFSQRFMVYTAPFETPEDYVIGYGFRGSQVALKTNTLLHVKDPHSLPIEMIYNFGFLGSLPFFGALVFLAFKLLKKLSINEIYRYGLVQFIFFLLLVNISSSVIKKPIVWIPYTLVMLIAVISKSEILSMLVTEKENNSHRTEK